MNSEHYVFPQDGVTPEQRHAMDQQAAWIHDNIGGMVAAAALHFEEDGCTEPDLCPGGSVSTFIVDELPEDAVRALLIGAICDLAGFFTTIKSGTFTQQALEKHFANEAVLYGQLTEGDDEQH